MPVVNGMMNATEAPFLLPLGNAQRSRIRCVPGIHKYGRHIFHLGGKPTVLRRFGVTFEVGVLAAPPSNEKR